MLQKPEIINLALIDDEEDFLRITESILKKKNDKYITKSFSSPLEFLDFLDKTRKTFDVIISDYEMPDMNGLEMLSRIKSNGSRTPFIMVTGKGRSEIIIDALNLGVDYYLEKSLDIESMYSELDHFISKASEKRFVEKELEELQEIYKTLIRLSPEGILIHVNSIIEFVNPAIISYLGYENETELIGKSVLDIIEPSDQERVRSRFPNMLNHEDVPFIHVKLTKKDKSFVKCEATGRGITYKGKKGIIAYIRSMENNQVTR